MYAIIDAIGFILVATEPHHREIGLDKARLDIRHSKGSVHKVDPQSD